MQIHGKPRREQRRRNFYAKELRKPNYAPKCVKEKKSHCIEALLEEEAEEELLNWLKKEQDDE